jgi:hypothetical protein
MGITNINQYQCNNCPQNTTGSALPTGWSQVDRTVLNPAGPNNVTKHQVLCPTCDGAMTTAVPSLA